MSKVMEITIRGWGHEHTYKVGERVGYYRESWSSGFGTITKINGHGHIIVKMEVPRADGVDEIEFDKYGDERKDARFGRKLCTEASLLEMNAEKEERNRAALAVEALKKEIEDHRCGNGRYNITEETKATLRALVEAL